MMMAVLKQISKNNLTIKEAIDKTYWKCIGGLIVYDKNTRIFSIRIDQSWHII